MSANQSIKTSDSSQHVLAKPDDGSDHSASLEETELSRQYSDPLGQPHTYSQTLKARIKQHYDACSDYYLQLW